MDQLVTALAAAQKLEKKLRQLRNQDRATDAEVLAAKAAVDIYRKLCVSFGVPAIDLDSRTERQRNR